MRLLSCSRFPFAPQLLHKELPYAVVQQNVAWNELADGTLRVEQDLWVRAACGLYPLCLFWACAER